VGVINASAAALCHPVHIIGTAVALKALAARMASPTWMSGLINASEEWIDMEFNKALLDCMQTLRRRLREEQQLHIRLSQPDAIPAMLAACLSSSDELTRDLGKQLAAYSDSAPATINTPPPPAAKENLSSVRIYRGQRVTG